MLPGWRKKSKSHLISFNSSCTIKITFWIFIYIYKLSIYVNLHFPGKSCINMNKFFRCRMNLFKNNHYLFLSCKERHNLWRQIRFRDIKPVQCKMSNVMHFYNCKLELVLCWVNRFVAAFCNFAQNSIIACIIALLISSITITHTIITIPGCIRISYDNVILFKLHLLREKDDISTRKYKINENK